MTEPTPTPGPARARRSGIALVMVLALAFAAFELGRGTERPLRCGRDVQPDADTIVMLSASWCHYCRAARRYLQGEHIAHCEYDIERDAEGQRRYAAMPVKMIPVLTLGDTTFIGFEREEIEKALQARGLRPM